jgi:TPP-dependent pyruvate/acetoin dehydrogenase alpha subunit
MNQTEVFYRQVLRIRRVEEEVARVYPTDKIKSPVHLSIGQEGVSVGICAALRKTDVVCPTYRGHALYLAKGGDLNAMIAELYGKVTGCTRGKGGSMHLIDVSAGVLGASAIVGTTIPLAVGYAYAQRVKKTDTVVASFFGDGAVDEGAFHESMNFAALHKLPVLFVCENNFYSIHSPQLARQPHANLCDRATSYGVKSEQLDGCDVPELYARAQAAVESVRAGDGPRFLECMTYRFREHVGPNEDFSAGYRSREEAEPWFARDPLRLLGQQLDPIVRTRIEAEVELEIADAFAFAESSPFPPSEELLADVYLEAL